MTFLEKFGDTHKLEGCLFKAAPIFNKWAQSWVPFLLGIFPSQTLQIIISSGSPQSSSRVQMNRNARRRLVKSVVPDMIIQAFLLGVFVTCIRFSENHILGLEERPPSPTWVMTGKISNLKLLLRILARFWFSSPKKLIFPEIMKNNSNLCLSTKKTLSFIS